MKKTNSFVHRAAIAVVGTVLFVGCTSSDDIDKGNVVYNEEGQAGVKPEFVISIPQTVVGGVTRMGNDVTQNLGTVAQFRGLDHIRLIPFNAAPTTASTKLADIMRLSNIQALSSPGAINYKVYSDQFVPVGTSHFLFYAKAIDGYAEQDITSMADKFRYGILKPTGLTEAEFTKAGDITFSLEPINTSTEAQSGDPIGRNIVNLLNSIANTTVSGVAAPNNAWSTSNEINMKNLYLNFIGTTVSSSKSLSYILSKLYFALDKYQSSSPAYALASAIKTKIESVCIYAPVSGNPVTLSAAYAGYPGNIGLPDGAARVRWNGGSTPNSFVDMTTNYTSGYTLKATEYAYPAALWYHANTTIKASNAIQSPNYTKAGNWDGVITSIYSGAASVVDDNTRSVALVDAAQYGVGRVETKIAMGSGTFFDGNGQVVETGSGYTLNGILLGGQNSVDYDFNAVGNENLTIYDRNMSSSTIIGTPGTTTAAANQTLALETKANQTVYAALELINGGEEFMGYDGIIPAGGTFYLAVKLDPTTATNYSNGTLDKIVMKDRVTKLTVTIKNGSATVDRDGDSNPDKYIKDDTTGKPTGVDTNNDGIADPYDIDGDGNNDTIITDPVTGIVGWDTDGDGNIDLPILPNPTDGKYPDSPTVPEGLGKATNGIPDLRSPGVELGTSVNLEWQEGLILNPSI